MFVPLAAFDRRAPAHRFWRRFLRPHALGVESQAPIRAVGVAFSTSEVESVPAEPHDEPLDFILTENEWIDARGSP